MHCIIYESSSAERITLRRGKDVAVPLYVFDKKRRYSLHLRPCIAVGDSPKFESCKLPLKEGIKKIETESFRKSRTSSLSDNYSTFIKKMQFNGTSGVDNYYFRICGSLSQFSNANNENQFEDRGNKTLFPKEISFVLLPALQIENIFPCPIVFSMIGTAEEEMLNKKILVLGSNSFSGASFCEHLLENEHNVYGVSRSSLRLDILI